jgi:hypothetical protein
VEVTEDEAVSTEAVDAVVREVVDRRPEIEGGVAPLETEVVEVDTRTEEHPAVDSVEIEAVAVVAEVEDLHLENKEGKPMVLIHCTADFY